MYPQQQGKRGLSTKDLREWYTNYGFEERPDGIMVRKPWSKENIVDYYYDIKEECSVFPASLSQQ